MLVASILAFAGSSTVTTTTVNHRGGIGMLAEIHLVFSKLR